MTTSRYFRPGRATIFGITAGIPLASLAALGAAYFAYADLPPVPVPPENPITEQKRVLGKILFWEEQLSSTNSVSCATCHTPARGGADNRIAIHPGPDGAQPSPDDRRASPGVPRSDAESDFLRDLTFALRPQVTDRAANVNINAAYAPSLFWDGRATGQFRDPVSGQVVIASGGALESQSMSPPVSGVEMAHDGINWAEITTKLAGARPLDLATAHPPDVSTALAGNVDYPELFRRAFGDTAITATRVALALATYQRTLIADDTPWDRFIAGNQTAMTPQQIQGWQAFQNSNCNLCHITPFFTGHGFRNIGIRPVAEDRGLQNTTGIFADRAKFKVPTLRNVGLKRTFMHNGQFQTVLDVIRFYARSPGSPPQFQDNLDPLLQQVNVPPQAIPLIDDFLSNGLTDARVASQTFPFDRPILASERPEHRVTPQGGGTPGSGGFIGRLVADMPPILGGHGFRIGLDLALGGARARLALSFAPPVAGRITPAMYVGEVITNGAGPGAGPTTFHWYLSPARFQNGQVFFLQWLIDDPGAPGGIAASDVVRVPVFCGSWGCPNACEADYNGDGFVDGLDYDRFNADFESPSPLDQARADINGDGFVDGIDYDQFNNDFEAGC